MNKIFAKTKYYLFIFPVIFVLIVAVPHLSLPFFWDEAWSYFPAVYKMYETGPGLLPGALPLWVAKGHPLFFFFIHSLWMRIFGTTVTAIHILSLLISVGTLMATYFLVKKHANREAAFISVLLLSVQSLFLAQATMVLPEMLLTLLLLISTGSYLSGRYGGFALAASLMVMTKETSIVFICGFLFMHLLVYIKSQKELRKYIRESILISIPLLVYALFLLLHKIKFGSFLFQEHTAYIELSLNSVLRKLQIATGMIFTRYGRNVVLAATLTALFILLYRKKKPESSNLLILILIQTIFFLLFSAINFYTQRYMLSLMTLFMVAASVLMVQVQFNRRWLNVLTIMLVASIPLYYSFTKKTNSDSDLGYVEVVEVHQKMVHYCEEQGWYDKPISASFNLIFCLKDPHLGYVSTQEGFSNVMNLQKFRDAKIIVNECTSSVAKAQLDSINNRNKLVKEFQQEHAWGKIYTSLPVK